MQSAVLIRLRPLGPWRYGAGEGGKDRVDKLFRSDRLYSAVTLAMREFGMLDEWLDVTARASSAQVAFSSLFPFQGDTLFAIPPRTLWPPPPSLLTSPSPVFLSKIRWNAAQFVPVSVIDSMLGGRPILADQWSPDPESGCLLRRDRPSTTPFRRVVRTRAAIDRLSQSSAHVDSFACIEFEAGAGLWCVARFADANAETQWSDRIKAAFRLLADTGFGGGRAIGWGQTSSPEFESGPWPNLLLPRSSRAARGGNGSNGHNSGYWLLSVYSPATSDSPDWSGGDYELITRGGHSRKAVRMISEGSVLMASQEPSGTAIDIALDGSTHPVYRAGFALALRLPEITEEDIKPVEEPADEEAPEAKPCPEPQTLSPAEPTQLHTEPEQATHEPIESEPEPAPAAEIEPAPAVEPEPEPHDNAEPEAPQEQPDEL